MANMTYAKAKEILARVRAEVYRRSGFDMDGEYLFDEYLRNLNGPILSNPDDSLFYIAPESDYIKALHGSPIINRLIEICDVEDLRTVYEYDPIPGAFDIDKLDVFLAQLENEAFISTNSSCRSSCTGLCMNACGNTCSGKCESACAACSIACSGACSAGCTGCDDTCGTTCGTSCGTSCGGVATSCSDCTAGCEGCTGCTMTCDSSCVTDCVNTCSADCTGACQGTSGYNESCGCGGDCSTACGNSAVSSPSTISKYAVSYYHNKNLYATQSSSKSIPIITPSFSSLGNVFEPMTAALPDATSSPTKSACWRCVDTTTTVEQETEVTYDPTDSFSESRIPTNILESKESRTPMKYDLITLSGELSYLTEVFPFRYENISETFKLTEETKIEITCRDYTGNYINGLDQINNVIINGGMVALPYTGICDAGTEITLTGNRVTYELTRSTISADAKVITVSEPTDVHFYVKCYQYEYTSDGLTTDETMAAIFVNNKYVAAWKNDVPITSDIIHLNTGDVLKLHASDYVCGININGYYYGVRFELCAELYTLVYTNGTLFTVDTHGVTDAENNVYLINSDSDTNEIITSIPLTRVNGSVNEFKFTIPPASEFDALENVGGFANAKDDTDTSLTYLYDNTYSTFTRQDICLFSRISVDPKAKYALTIMKLESVYTTYDIEEGSSIILPTVDANMGDTFYGYSLSSNSTSIKYTAGNTINISENMILYAVFTYSAEDVGEDPISVEGELTTVTKEYTIMYDGYVRLTANATYTNGMNAGTTGTSTMTFSQKASFNLQTGTPLVHASVYSSTGVLLHTFGGSADSYYSHTGETLKIMARSYSGYYNGEPQYTTPYVTGTIPIKCMVTKYRV